MANKLTTKQVGWTLVLLIMSGDAIGSVMLESTNTMPSSTGTSMPLYLMVECNDDLIDFYFFGNDIHLSAMDYNDRVQFEFNDEPKMIWIMYQVQSALGFWQGYGVDEIARFDGKSTLDIKMPLGESSYDLTFDVTGAHEKMQEVVDECI